MNNITRIYDNICDWMDGSGPLSDIVVSSRIRLARNVSGFVFSTQADEQQRDELLHYLHDQIMETELKNDLWYLEMSRTTSLERSMLAERHLISGRLAEGNTGCGVALSHDESLTLMLNEEDHVRIQVLASGLQLEETYENINRIDNLLEEKIEYSFSPRYGYLTACPTNVGTGMRVSVMLHLPALKITGQIEKVFRAAREMRLAIRGLYGEGTEPIGDFYQLSNQTTLGKTEQQIIEQLVNLAVEPIVEYERQARNKLLKEQTVALDDKIHRAVGALTHARLISSEETSYLLSLLRLGIQLDRVKDISLRTVNELFLLTQPAHLQHHYKQTMDAGQRDELRARFIREHLR